MEKGRRGSFERKLRGGKEGCADRGGLFVCGEKGSEGVGEYKGYVKKRRMRLEYGGEGLRGVWVV